MEFVVKFISVYQARKIKIRFISKRRKPHSFLFIIFPYPNIMNPQYLEHFYMNLKTASHYFLKLTKYVMNDFYSFHFSLLISFPHINFVTTRYHIETDTTIIAIR